MTSIRRLPLHEQHVAKKAKLGAFGDWEVPLYYTSILEEHSAVRTGAGLFDISHMGEFFFSGSGVVAFLDGLLPRNIGAMQQGQALYMPLLNEKGGMVDDIIVYRWSENEFLMIVNAGNVAKDAAWIRKQLEGVADVTFEDQTEAKGLLALQGPKSALVMKKAFPEGEFDLLDYYHFKPFQSGMVARTGYTGEDGFEIMVDKAELEGIWNRLFEAGSVEKLVPVGFGARDTLRLEAGMLLYGHDMNDEVTPLEAGIGWTLDWAKENFVGREPLAKQKEAGIKRRIVGFEMLERGIPREHYAIQKNGTKLGEVTSGSFSPSFKKNIGLGFVPKAEATPENEIEIIVREKPLKAKIIKLPFYKRTK